MPERQSKFMGVQAPTTDYVAGNPVVAGLLQFSVRANRRQTGQESERSGHEKSFTSSP